MQINISNLPASRSFTFLNASKEQCTAVAKVASKRYSSQFPYRTYIKHSAKCQSMVFLSQQQRDRVIQVLKK